MTRDEQVAAAFSALAHPRRVQLYRLLCAQPELGGSFLSLQRATGFKDAPLLHHLRIMERSGLISRRRKGPHTAQTITPRALQRAMTEVETMRTRPANNIQVAS